MGRRQEDTKAAYLLACRTVERNLEESLQEVLVEMMGLELEEAPRLGLVFGWPLTVEAVKSVYLESVSSLEELPASYEGRCHCSWLQTLLVWH